MLEHIFIYITCDRPWHEHVVVLLKLYVTAPRGSSTGFSIASVYFIEFVCLMSYERNTCVEWPWPSPQILMLELRNLFASANAALTFILLLRIELSFGYQFISFNYFFNTVCIVNYCTLAECALYAQCVQCWTLDLDIQQDRAERGNKYWEFICSFTYGLHLLLHGRFSYFPNRQNMMTS